MPAFAKVTVGFSSVLVAGFPPSNVHTKVSALEEEVLLKVTVKGAQLLVSVAVKPAVGSLSTKIVISSEVTSLPHSFVAVKVTV